MKKNRFLVAGMPAVTLVLGLVLAGCPTGGVDLPMSTIEWELGDDENSDTPDLPVSTIKWELGDDGFVQFYTNDSQWYDYYFWRSYYNHGGSNTYEIDCKKISGNRSYAYGMIFGMTSSDRFYCVWINADGYYTVFKRDGDTDTTLKDWVATDKLYTGYDKINNIKVTQLGTDCTVYLNNSPVCQFTDTDSSITGGEFGCYVTIGTQEYESFPNNPVDVRFRLP